MKKRLYKKDCHALHSRLGLRRMLASAALCIIMISAYCTGQAAQISVYAASSDNVSKFKAVGDSFETSCSIAGQTTATARIEKVTHNVKLSGLYTVEIWTPKGDDAPSGYGFAPGGAGKYVSADIKIVQGSTFITAGSYADGVGIMGVLQLTGGNGANGSWDGRTPTNGGSGYFGGNGGIGVTQAKGSGNFGRSGSAGGNGYYGGRGGSGINASYDGGEEHDLGHGGQGGDGIYPGFGGPGGGALSNGKTAINGQMGRTLNSNVFGYTLNQNAAGSYQYYKSSLFPAVAVQSYQGRDAKIKITLKELLPAMELSESVIQDIPEEGVISYELAQIKMEIRQLADLLGQGTDNIPDITVVKGKPFSKIIAAYDAMTGGSSSGVSVTNTDQSDGVIQVSGVLDQEGEQTVQINGSTFIFHVIEEPDSANVTVIFD